jgi:dipeptidyl aminopeptidase/acylaminoacyl peptidase
MDTYKISTEMEIGQLIKEKYLRNRWPTLPRPDRNPPKGWSLVTISYAQTVHHHHLSPDGKKAAFVWQNENNSEIYTLALDGGNWPERITFGRPLIRNWTDEGPRFSPDGRWLAFSMDNHVYITPSAGGLPKKITDFTTQASTPVWMPDSSGLIISSERNEYTCLLLTDREGSWPRALTHGTAEDSEAQPSSDGKLVAFIRRTISDLNRQDIMAVDLASGEIRRLAGEPGQKNLNPRWSPDGKTLAFISQKTGWNEIWLVDSNGENLRQITHAGQDFSQFTWAPEGTHLAAVLNRRGAFDLVQVSLADGAITDLHCAKGVHRFPTWSENGAFLTVEYSSPSEPGDLYRLDMPNKHWTRLTNSKSPALQNLQLVTPSEILYKSFDGLEIQGLLYQPEQPNGAAIVYPHGGPRGQSTYDWDILSQYLLAKGYTILSPNYRGGTGFGYEFEHANDFSWGIGDTQDCLYAARFLQKIPGIDPKRLAIYGHSYGGYMVLCCLARDPDYLFSCGVDMYGDADTITSWAASNRRLSLYSEMQLGDPVTRRQVYLDGSPIYQMDNIQKPILILHGNIDSVVPTLASEEIVEALLKADKSFEYKTYNDEGHGFIHREAVLDAYTRIDRFLDWYLYPKGEWE